MHAYSDMTPDRAAHAAGPYYGREEESAAPGFGANGDASSFVVAQLMGILKGTQPGVMRVDPPLGLFTPWGISTGDIDWDTVASPTYDLLVYPLRQEQIDGAKKSAGGHPVPWVGMMTSRPVPPGRLEEALDMTPYELIELQGVYRQSGSSAVPRIYFLYWFQLDDEPARGGGMSIERLAKAIGGKLVFPLQTERRSHNRYHPSIPFDAAVQAQLGARTERASELGKVVAISGIESAPDKKKLLGVGAVGVLLALALSRRNP